MQRRHSPLTKVEKGDQAVNKSRFEICGGRWGPRKAKKGKTWAWKMWCEGYKDGWKEWNLVKNELKNQVKK